MPATKKDNKEQTQETIGQDMIAEVRQALASARATLEAAATRQAEDAREMLKLARSRQVKALGKKEQTVQKRLPQIADAAKAHLAEAKALQTFQARVLAQVDEDLGALLQRFAPPPEKKDSSERTGRNRG